MIKKIGLYLVILGILNIIRIVSNIFNINYLSIFIIIQMIGMSIIYMTDIFIDFLIGKK